MTNVRDCVVIENAKIIFRNFSGQENKYNRPGSRNFCVIIDDEKMADELKRSGWNVRILPPKEVGDEATNYIQVSVNFDSVQPPTIYLVTRKRKTKLDETTVGSLDYAEITNVDLIIRPYNWEANGKCGVKAYLKSLYATIIEDEFAKKYEDLEGPGEI